MTNKKICDDTFIEFNFFGFKNINPILCNSEWMANYLHFLEWDTKVKSYFQPEMFIPVEYARISMGVQIDLWVNLCDGNVYLIHFKGDGGERSPADHPAAYAQCEQFCRQSNLNFQVVDQTLPEPEPRKNNINLLWNYAERETLLGHFWLVNKFFAVEYLPDVGKFKRALVNSGYDPDAVYTLLFHHAVEANLNHFSLSDETPITKGDVSKILFEQIKPADDFDDSTVADFDPEVF